MISSFHYHDNNHFIKELDTIFKNNWLFVGTESELAKNNDFVTLDIGDYSVVVQNFRGAIKAFKNVCLHRFARLQTKRKGNRPLFCQYHGWAYTASGNPIVSENFRQDAKELSCEKLEEYEIEKCGIFYFVKVSGNPQSLTDFLGDYYPLLEEMSSAIGEEVHNREMPHKTNWKLLVENVVECYHCKILHANSLVKLGFGAILPVNYRESSKHNDCEYPKSKNLKDEEAKTKRLSFLQYRLRQHESYHHIFIYPNFFVASLEGTAYNITNIIPLSATESVLNVRLHSPKLAVPDDAAPVGRAIFSAFGEMITASNIVILNEDKETLESIQSVIAKVDRTPLFGKEEFRIDHFYRNYFSDVK